MTAMSRPASRKGKRNVSAAPEYDDVDLAIVAESTYPYLRGGVSAVIHDIVQANPGRSIGIIHIAWDSNSPTERAYEMPPNVRWVYPVFLSMSDHAEDFQLASPSALPLSTSERQDLSTEVFAALDALVAGDTGPIWRLYDRLLNPRTRAWPLWALLTTQEFMTSALGRFADFGIPFTELFWLLREFFSLTCAIAGGDFPKAAVYHSHTTGYAGLLAAIAARQNSGRVLLTEHNLYTRDSINALLNRNMSTVVSASDWHTDHERDPTERAWMAWYTEIGRLIYRAADQITYLYPAAIAEAEGLGSDATKSDIVPNGMMLDKFESARTRFLERRAEIHRSGEQPTWRLAYCARLVPIKGLSDLISSVAEIVQAGVTSLTLDVMGHADEVPDYAAECYRRASELDLDDYIRFRGNTNVADVLGDFDMLILPSYNEGQPLVVMEAMAVGLPIIGTPVGGMEQLVLSSLGKDPASGPGACGLLVQPGDVSGLTAAIRSLITNKELYRIFSENSRTRISQYFELDTAMSAYRLIYGQLEGAQVIDPSMIPAPRPAERPSRLANTRLREVQEDVLLAAAVSAADHRVRVLAGETDRPPALRRRPPPGVYGRHPEPAASRARPAAPQLLDAGAIPRPRTAASGPGDNRGGEKKKRAGSGGWRYGLATAGLAAGIAAGALGLAVAQAGSGQPARPPATYRAGHDGNGGPPADARIGALGAYRVGQARFTFTEPGHTGPSGMTVGARALLTDVRYPVAGRPGHGSTRPAAGQFPLIIFARGFRQCGAPYAQLLQAWASAGYVVVTEKFSHASCTASPASARADLINQPADVSFEITRLTAASTRRHGLLADLIDKARIAVAGPADGGDSVAAVAASCCYADRRVRAVAVLSTAGWPSKPGRFLSTRDVSTLFVQSKDPARFSASSVQFYEADRARGRYYLDLDSAGDGTLAAGAAEQLTTQMTLEFFNRWLHGQLTAGPAIATGAPVGIAMLVGGDRPPPQCGPIVPGAPIAHFAGLLRLGTGGCLRTGDGRNRAEAGGIARPPAHSRPGSARLRPVLAR